MNIDTSIIDIFISEKSDENIEKHWIFDKIVEGKYLYQMPKVEHIDEYKNIRRKILSALKNFEPINTVLWNELYNDYKVDNEDFYIMIIVGSPAPYDAFVREDELGKKVIVFDAERLLNYGDAVVSAIMNIVTHEVSHIYNYKIHNLYDNIDNKLDELKQMLFDEGFAHYVSSSHLYNSNSKSRNDELKENIYSKLSNALKSEIDNKILEDGNSGNFWDKFISISGYFSIFDYIDDGGTAGELFQRGYNYFWEYWESNNDI